MDDDTTVAVASLLMLCLIKMKKKRQKKRHKKKQKEIQYITQKQIPKITKKETLQIKPGKTQKETQRKQRRWSVIPLNRERNIDGQFQHFLKLKNNVEQFFIYTRMSVNHYDIILNLVTPKLIKTSRRESLSPEHRLAMTLHFLSQGISIQALAFSYKVGRSTVHKVLRETCKAICEVLSPFYIRPPSSEEDWKSISEDFLSMWNFPNCIGALDGKLINIQARNNTGNQYFNNNKKFSIVLMAACDANYCFTLFDIGAYGTNSDGAVFNDSVFGKKIETGDFNIPDRTLLTGTNILCPYTFVADEAFPLKNYILRPYPGKNLNRIKTIFNCRLSHAWKTIENSFGILSARWRVLRQDLEANIDNVHTLVQATICLHNFLRINESKVPEHARCYCPPGYIDTGDNANGDWRKENNELEKVGRLSANNARRELYINRDKLAEYFISANGEIAWQYENIEQNTN